jgi:hypothetical protein
MVGNALDDPLQRQEKRHVGSGWRERRLTRG